MTRGSWDPSLLFFVGIFPKKMIDLMYSVLLSVYNSNRVIIGITIENQQILSRTKSTNNCKYLLKKVYIYLIWCENITRNHLIFDDWVYLLFLHQFLLHILLHTMIHHINTVNLYAAQMLNFCLNKQVIQRYQKRCKNKH